MHYARPSTLADALAILAAGGTPLAGGTLSVPEVANAAAGSRDSFFIDLAGLPSLHDVAERDGFLYVGAMVTLAEVAASTLIADSWTALAEAARAVGNPNVRRAATVGGNVAWRTGAPASPRGPARARRRRRMRHRNRAAGADRRASSRRKHTGGRAHHLDPPAARTGARLELRQVRVAGGIGADDRRSRGLARSDTRRRPLAATCRVWCDRTCRSPSRWRGPPGDAGLRPEPPSRQSPRPRPESFHFRLSISPRKGNWRRLLAEGARRVLTAVVRR